MKSTNLVPSSFAGRLLGSVAMAAFMLAVSTLSHSVTRAPLTQGQFIKVKTFFLRNADVPGLDWTEQAFIFSASNDLGEAQPGSGSCLNTTFFYVPKKNPVNPGEDNPLYKDYVSLLITANVFDRSVAVHWDGCVQVGGSTYLKVVGINVQP